MVQGEGAVWGLIGKDAKFRGFPPKLYVPDQQVIRIDPTTSQVTARSATLQEPYEVGVVRLVVGAGAVWVAVDFVPPSILKIDPVTGQVSQTIRLRKRRMLDRPHEVLVAVADGAVWATVYPDEVLYRIDPRTNNVTTIKLRYVPTDVIAGLGAVWIQWRNGGEYVLDRFDPTTERVVSTIHAPPGSEMNWNEVGAGAVWTVANVTLPSGGVAKRLLRLDPTSDAITADIDLLASAVANLAPDGSVWVAAYDNTDPHPESTVRILQIDPANNSIVQTISVSKVGDRSIKDPHIRVHAMAGSVWACAHGVGIFRIS